MYLHSRSDLAFHSVRLVMGLLPKSLLLNEMNSEESHWRNELNNSSPLVQSTTEVICQ